MQVYIYCHTVYKIMKCKLNFYFIAVKGKEPDKLHIPDSQQAQLMLEVGSEVEFGDPVQYGVIQQIKIDPVVHKKMVEVEMVCYSAINYNMYCYKCHFVLCYIKV